MDTITLIVSDLFGTVYTVYRISKLGLDIDFTCIIFQFDRSSSIYVISIKYQNININLKSILFYGNSRRNTFAIL